MFFVSDVTSEVVLWLERSSDMCVKVHTVAACNNRDHVPQSLYYCLFAPHIYGCCSSCTCRSWWIAHSTQRHWSGCNSRFLAILAHVTWPRAQLLDQSILLNFSLETRIEPKYFEPLIDFLAFLIQKLWSKMNKLINFLIMGLINYFVFCRS